MKLLKNNIARNLSTLRQLNQFSQEEVAERDRCFPAGCCKMGSRGFT